jgi:hypothetical protein
MAARYTILSALLVAVALPATLVRTLCPVSCVPYFTYRISYPVFLIPRSPYPLPSSSLQISLTSAIDNLWLIASERADQAGKELAKVGTPII